MDNEPYVILDIKGLIQHSYHAGKDPEPTFEEDGTEVNTASFGFNTFLDIYPLFETVPPRRIIAVWEGGNEFRRDLFPGYKGKRAARSAKEKVDAPAREEELVLLYRGVKAFLASLGCTQVKADGAEADDVIGMLCQQLDPCPIGVYTVDEDMYQLQDERVTIAIKRHMDNNKGPITEPQLIALHKSMVGDPTDEYPGVAGLGAKGWETLVADFGIDGMEELRDIVRDRNFPKMQEVVTAIGQHKQIQMLHEQFEQWCTMYQLAILHPEICYRTHKKKVIRPQWAKRVPNRAQLESVLRQLGAAHHLENFERWMYKEEIISVSNKSPELQSFMSLVGTSPICAFDYESFDPAPHQPFNEAKTSTGEFVDMLQQKVTGVSFCFGDNYQHVMYMPCRHVETDVYKNWPQAHIAWAVRYAQAAVPLVAHNAVFEMVLSQNDLEIEDLKSPYDTGILASHVDEDEPMRLKHLSKQWLNFTQQSYRELLDAHGVDNMSQLTAEQVLTYGCDDSLVTAHLFDLFWLITKCEGTWEFIRDNEFDFAQEQVRAYLTGVRVDEPTIKALEHEAEITVTEQTAKLRSLLATNCKDYNQEGATTLFNDMWEFEQAKLSAAGATEEDVKNKQTTIWESCYFSSKYIEYQEIKGEPAEVKLTPSPLEKVSRAIGYETTPKIEKLTKKFLTEEWYPMAEEEFAADMDPNADKREFAVLIKEVINAKALKKPETEEYQELAKFCAGYLNTETKTTYVGDELNFGSPVQMQQLLYCKMGLPIRSRSKVTHGSARDKLKLRGAPGTDKTAVAYALAEDVEPGDWRYDALLAYKAAKTASTQLQLFLRPLPLWVHPMDNAVHPQFKNCGTATRRPTGTAPNLLQLTKKDGGKLRSAFRARYDSHVIVSADFNGQELRITASESKDPMLLDAYIGEHKKDVHSVTAAAIAPSFLRQQMFIEKYGILDLLNQKEVPYEDFMEWRSTTGGLGAAADTIRKSAKACIAEGSPVLTDRGLVPIEQVTRADRVWDGVEWVTHEGVIYKGIREVITYDGVTATPDHQVFTQDGRNLPIGDCASEPARPSLAVGAIDDRPVGYERGAERSVLGEGQEQRHHLRHREVPLHRVRETGGSERAERAAREEQELRVPVYAEEVHRCAAAGAGGAAQRYASAMHQPEEPLLAELRGPGDRGQVRIQSPLHLVDDGEPAARELPWDADRQDRQQRPLRAREYPAGNAAGKPDQQTDNEAGGVSWTTGGATASLALAENGLPGGGFGGGRGRSQAPGKRLVSRGDSSAEATRTARVYDIVNAGPRHRFTVSGRVVSNCNFLITYLGGYTTLSENLMIPGELAKELMSSTFDRYARLQPWQEETIEFARRHGYTQTAYGNRRHLNSKLFASDRAISTRIERQAVNATIQGCAADVLKEVLATCHRERIFTGNGAVMIAPVYDELVASVPRETVVDFSLALKEAMEVTPPGHQVPMLAEFSYGAESWGNLIEVGATIDEDIIMGALDKGRAA